jgi:hypothetical protein
VVQELVSQVVGVAATECCDRTEGARCRFKIEAGETRTG